MDQNTPREDAAGPQPPAEPGSGDPAAWNQTSQAGTPDQPQAAPAGGAQEAAAEHAAWSADATYQQQAQQPAPTSDTQAHAAQQPAPTSDTQAHAAQQPAPTSDTQAYAAPEPQSATYTDPAAPTADQQAYAQQQQAYAQQQQAAYDQQAQQQPQPQQAYDQQAYAQQQQAYAQQQQAYAQQQQQQQPQQAAYDQQAQQAQQAQQPQQPQQPQYYDQNAYGQQPGYYDQSAYGQQQGQYPQQQGYQQPYAYGQPGQQPWPGGEQNWEEGGSRYGRSFLAVIAGFVLLTLGLVFAMGGGMVLWLGNLNDVVTELTTLTAAQQDLVDEFDQLAVGYGGILLLLGLVQMIGAVGILAHRKWGRAFGIVLGLIGTIWGIGMVLTSLNFSIGDVDIDGALAGDEAALGVSVLFLVFYLIVLMAMFLGRRHFKKKGVES